MERDFWRGKRVLLTGHTGFKGSWLSLWLQKAGAELLGYALPPATPSLFALADLGTGMRSLHADIRDREQLGRAFGEWKPEIVFHLAAQALVRESYRQPVDTFETNVMGTVQVLEAVRLTPGVKAVLIITSDKCYENREWVWGYRESDPMGGRDPYSASKGCAELVVSSYQRSFFSLETHAQHGVAVASARAGNVIGGGDWAADRLIPDAIRAFLEGKPLTVRNPQSVRPWQHVLEPLDGYLTLAERLYRQGPAFAGAWNFGPESRDSRPVAEVVGSLARLWGDRVSWEQERTAQPHEAGSLRLDCSKAQAQLGWTPRLPLESALEWVVRWWKDWQRGANVRAISTRDIDQYEALRP
jgi:CDP-glucose 4,6-dehydratase